MQYPDIDTVAIGRFDGMHLGHMALAERLGPHGMLVVIDTLSGDLTPASLLPRFSRIPFYRLEFANIRHLSPAEFVMFLQETFPRLTRVIVGEDFRFGCGRSGDTTALRKLFTGEVEIVPELTLDSEPIRSSRIRHHISQGNIARANALLGREYEIFARAVSAEVLVADPFLLPPPWIYPVRRTDIRDASGMSIRITDERTLVVDVDSGLLPGAEYGFAFLHFETPLPR